MSRSAGGPLVDEWRPQGAPRARRFLEVAGLAIHSAIAPPPSRNSCAWSQQRSSSLGWTNTLRANFRPRARGSFRSTPSPCLHVARSTAHATRRDRVAAAFTLNIRCRIGHETARNLCANSAIQARKLRLRETSRSSHSSLPKELDWLVATQPIRMSVHLRGR